MKENDQGSSDVRRIDAPTVEQAPGDLVAALAQLEGMARYRREGRTGTRSVADLAEADACDVGAAMIRRYMSTGI
jgi:hypothetical protein